MYRNYVVSRSERLAFGSIGAAARRSERAAQPKPESFSLDDLRKMSAPHKFDYEVRRLMKHSNISCSIR